MRPKQRKPGILTRRDFLLLGAATTALAACNRLPGSLQITNQATTATRAVAPSTTPLPTATATSHAATTPLPTAEALLPAPLRTPALDWLAANRLMFGPRPGDLQHIDEIGVDEFIEEQLASDAPDDDTLQAKLQPLDTLAMSPVDMAQAKRPDLLLQLQQATLLRAVYGKRQLSEVMVDFWSNHFNAWLTLSDCPTPR